MTLTWHVNGISSSSDRFTANGMIETLEGAVHAVVDVDNISMTDVRAEMPLTCDEDERIFMNGYQTWTYSPEYSRHSSIRGINGLPKRIVDQFALD
ncbi:MAG TPA: alpha-galactosidase, partial [Erysipelotrichaceae bacterium]|nr:alpha-galactosidase [Erysipelotrichaceae bacterium]